MMLAILVTARAHNSQYDWTVKEPQALELGLEPEVIDVIRNRGRLDGLDEKDAAPIAFALELRVSPVPIRLRQHTELWHALHAEPEPKPAAKHRRRSQQEVATT